MGCDSYSGENTCLNSGCAWCPAGSGCCLSASYAGQACTCSSGLVAWQIASIVIGVLFWIFICTCIIRCCRRRNQTIVVASASSSASSSAAANTTVVIAAPYQNFNQQQQPMGGQPMMGQPIYQQQQQPGMYQQQPPMGQPMMGQPMYQQQPPAMMNGVQYSPINQTGSECAPNNTQFGAQ